MIAHKLFEVEINHYPHRTTRDNVPERTELQDQI